MLSLTRWLFGLGCAEAIALTVGELFLPGAAPLYFAGWVGLWYFAATLSCRSWLVVLKGPHPSSRRFLLCAISAFWAVPSIAGWASTRSFAENRIVGARVNAVDVTRTLSDHERRLSRLEERLQTTLQSNREAWAKEFPFGYGVLYSDGETKTTHSPTGGPVTFDWGDVTLVTWGQIDGPTISDGATTYDLGRLNVGRGAKFGMNDKTIVVRTIEHDEHRFGMIIGVRPTRR